jgi:hypothetical protein
MENIAKHQILSPVNERILGITLTGELSASANEKLT